MNKIILMLFLFLFGSVAMAEDMVGKFYDPCKGWSYFTDKEIQWVYSDGIKINETFYERWQFFLFKEIKDSKRESVSNRIEELTKSMVETGRIELSCEEE